MHEYGVEVHPWGILPSRDGLIWPGDLSLVAGGFIAFFPGSFPVAVIAAAARRGGPAGAPAAAVAARTNELDAGARRPMMGLGEGNGQGVGAGFPVCVAGRSGLTCTHAAPRL